MIPDWLVPWWNWWADFTALFRWPAISALLSSIAIFFTISLADRSRRDAHRQEAAHIRAAARTFHALAQSMEELPEEATAEELVLEARSLLSAWEEGGFLEMIGQIDGRSLSHPAAITTIFGAQATIKVVHAMATRADQGKEAFNRTRYLAQRSRLLEIVAKLERYALETQPGGRWNVIAKMMRRGEQA